MDDVIAISVVRDKGIYARLFNDNPNWKDCRLEAIDNTGRNDHIGVCYNRFIESIDLTKSAWLVFCHEDWELKEPVKRRLADIDKASLWGVIGAVTIRRYGFYAQWKLLGEIEESSKDGANAHRLGEKAAEGTQVDTFDCQALIVHASLIKSLDLRFDENLSFDLYVEDFCIAASEKGGVVSRILPLECRHWSGGNVLPRYKIQEEYLNNKWRSAKPYTGGSSLLLGGRAPWWWRFTVAAKKLLRGIMERK